MISMMEYLYASLWKLSSISIEWINQSFIERKTMRALRTWFFRHVAFSTLRNTTQWTNDKLPSFLKHFIYLLLSAPFLVIFLVNSSKSSCLQVFLLVILPDAPLEELCAQKSHLSGELPPVSGFLQPTTQLVRPLLLFNLFFFKSQCLTFLKSLLSFLLFVS